MTQEKTDLTDRFLRTLKPTGRRYYVSDRRVQGLRLVIGPSGSMSWRFDYRVRAGGRTLAPRSLALGGFPDVTLGQARDAARSALNRVAQGGDPAEDRRAELDRLQQEAEERERRAEAAKRAAELDAIAAGDTIAAVSEQFLRHVETKRSRSTFINYRGALRKHIIPALGHVRVPELTRREVAALHEAMKAQPIGANRMLACFGAMIAWCELEGIRDMGTNPTRRIPKYAETRRQRFLGNAEVMRLGAALHTAETIGLPASPAMKAKDRMSVAGERVRRAKMTGAKRGPYRATEAQRPTQPADRFAVAAIRLALLCGWRFGEIVSTAWQDVDLARAVVAHRRTKSGQVARPLSAPAVALLSDLPRLEGSKWVFPRSSDPSRHIGKPTRLWDSVRHHAGLWTEDRDHRVMSHDLRHTFGAQLATGGASLPVIASLLGHRQVSTSEIYAHLAADVRRDAIDRAAGELAAALAEGAATVEAAGDAVRHTEAGARRSTVLPLTIAPATRKRRA